MTIMEMRDEADARSRLRDFYGLEGHDAAPYVQLLGLLCGFHGYPSFERELEKLSNLLWMEYRMPGMELRPNRFTRSIINLANSQFGFVTQDNVVFAGPLSGAAFGARVRGKVLWKDSFALGHGEFSHSYQWLVAGLAFNWGPQTGHHYANVAAAGRMSRVPLFAKDNHGMSYRRSPLWEFLVDCTLWQSWFDGAGRLKDAVEAWREKEARAREPLVVNDPLGSYPIANALTKDTFRSANNVATLAAKQKTWFISLYEAHRAAVLREAQERGRSMIENLTVPSMTKSLRDALNDRGAHGGDEKSLQYKARVDQNARRAAVHPIEAIKAERALHYKLETNYKNPDKYVYSRSIDAKAQASPKELFWVEFHGDGGFANVNPGLLV